MMKLDKFGTAVALSLVFSLTIFNLGVMARGEDQSMSQNSKISVSAHAATMQSVLQGTASMMLNSALQRPNSAHNNCGNWGRGNGCGGFNNCGGNHCDQPHLTTRCASERECHSVQVCHWTHGGRVCHGERVCRFRSICRRCFDHDGGGWNRAWGVKQH